MKNLLEKIFKYKKALRAVDVVVNGKVIKPRSITIANQLVKNCDARDIALIAKLGQTPAFSDICDILRISNSINKDGKTYDNFPEDFLQIANALKFVLKN